MPLLWLSHYADDMLMKSSDLILLRVCCTGGKIIKRWSAPSTALAVCSCVCAVTSYVGWLQERENIVGYTLSLCNFFVLLCTLTTHTDCFTAFKHISLLFGWMLLLLETAPSAGLWVGRQKIFSAHNLYVLLTFFFCYIFIQLVPCYLLKV